jgi:DNA-directed RNA polymerase subunit RPC12/RpoP
MAIVFHCECGKELRSKDDFAGKRTKCPACGAAILIPVPVKAEPAKAAEKKPAPSPYDDPIPFDADELATPSATAAATAAPAAAAPARTPAAEPPSSLIKLDAAVSGPAGPVIEGTLVEGGHQYRVLTPKDYGIAAKFNPELLEKTLNDFGKAGWSLKSAVVMSVATHAGSHDELIVILEH